MCWYWPPHADDEVLGCGGAISRHVQAGDRVIVAVLTNASVGAPELYPANTSTWHAPKLARHMRAWTSPRRSLKTFRRPCSISSPYTGLPI